MKKMNKKGFTLIELLAVIIILGILMIIAIPSVTEYITNSRKSALVDTASGYIDGVRNKVNEAIKLQFFDVNTLYLVPVGHETENSCVTLEKGGTSPFSDTWEYAYVGVTYNGTGYTYYFIAKDGSNQGINFVSQRELADKETDLVVSGTNELRSYSQLKDAYSNGSGANYAYITSTPEEGSSAVEWVEATNASAVTAIKDYVEDNETGKTISTILITKASECK